LERQPRLRVPTRRREFAVSRFRPMRIYRFQTVLSEMRLQLSAISHSIT
jgi:hypothetical protein